MMSHNVLIDSGFWIALYDPGKNQENHHKAEQIANKLENNSINIIIPFPTLYEFVNSRLSRRQAKHQFEKLLQKRNVIKLADTEYKEKALDNFFIKTKSYYSDLSLVDEVLKLMLEDVNLRIHFIATFDSGLKSSAAAYGISEL